MALPLYCSNILYSQAIDTRYDFTVSFTYTMNTSGFNPSQNYGFSVFFINGNVPSLIGGGCGPGLGAVSSTTNTSTSAVSGIFLTLGFDITGEFSKVNGLPVFLTGTALPEPNSIGLRLTTDFVYITSFNIFSINPYLFGPLGPAPTAEAYQTVRICARKNFNQIDIYSLNNQTYIKLATFQTNISSLPNTAKFGVGYSGDTLFEVQNITLNYT